MYIYIHTYIHTHIHIHNTYIYIHTHIHTYIHTHTYIYTIISLKKATTEFARTHYTPDSNFKILYEKFADCVRIDVFWLLLFHIYIHTYIHLFPRKRRRLISRALTTHQTPTLKSYTRSSRTV